MNVSVLSDLQTDEGPGVREIRSPWGRDRELSALWPPGSSLLDGGHAAGSDMS